MAQTIAAAGVTVHSTGRTMADNQPTLSRIVISGFRGTSTSDPEIEQIRRYLEAGEIAGVIFLGRNIRSPDQLLKLSIAFRDAAGSVTPILSVDQEGGVVARLGAEQRFSDWMSPAEMTFSGITEAEATLDGMVEVLTAQ